MRIDPLCPYAQPRAEVYSADEPHSASAAGDNKPKAKQTVQPVIVSPVLQVNTAGDLQLDSEHLTPERFVKIKEQIYEVSGLNLDLDRVTIEQRQSGASWNDLVTSTYSAPAYYFPIPNSRVVILQDRCVAIARRLQWQLQSHQINSFNSDREVREFVYQKTAAHELSHAAHDQNAPGSFQAKWGENEFRQLARIRFNETIANFITHSIANKNGLATIHYFLLEPKGPTALADILWIEKIATELGVEPRVALKLAIDNPPTSTAEMDDPELYYVKRLKTSGIF